MCVIISLPPKVNIPYPMLENAVWNNPHGYGLIVQQGSKLAVTRKLNVEGTDPKEVDEILRANDDNLRHIHLRWMTEGDITLDNVQPFRVYNKKGHEIWFMHNGTLYDYKPGKFEDGTTDPRSDSRIFADTVLVPFLKMTNGEANCDIARETLSKFWGPALHNKGLLVSNLNKPVILNAKEWKDIKTADDNGNEVTFYSSNDTYFDKLERGFEYEKREEARKQKVSQYLTFQQATEAKDSKEWGITKLKDTCFKPNQPLTQELVGIMEDFDLWTDEGLAALDTLTEEEIFAFTKNYPIAAGSLLIYITGCFSRVVEERETEAEKHAKASKMIAELKGQINVGASIG